MSVENTVFSEFNDEGFDLGAEVFLKSRLHERKRTRKMNVSTLRRRNRFNFYFNALEERGGKWPVTRAHTHARARAYALLSGERNNTFTCSLFT